MSGLRVLISGAGISGPVAAYWLSKAGAKVTVVERASSLRTGGQNVDIRGHGLIVLKRMDLEQTVYDNTTEELGLRFVDTSNVTKAEFPATGDQSFSAEVEIMRGTMASLLYEKTKDCAEFVFGTYITNITEKEDHTTVEFANGRSPQDFDLVIAADGQSSTTRSILFGDASKDDVKSLGQFMAWFKMPQIESDDRWARWCNTPGRRCTFIRPDTKNKNDFVRVVIAIIGHEDELRPALQSSITEQKALWRKMFSGSVYQEERILTAVDEADDFYMQEVVQVKTEKWYNGRTVLTGDAAYAPSPISGIGTTLAITGPYVLAGEIAKQPHDVPAAFKAYEDKMRPFVTKGQKIAPGAPWIANPETAWGISILYGLGNLVSKSGLLDLMQKVGFAAPRSKAMELPEYSY